MCISWCANYMSLRNARCNDKDSIGHCEKYFHMNMCLIWETRWRSWLRHCAKTREVAGSIPDDVIGTF